MGNRGGGDIESLGRTSTEVAESGAGVSTDPSDTDPIGTDPIGTDQRACSRNATAKSGSRSRHIAPDITMQCPMAADRRDIQKASARAIVPATVA
jgi:hypothetical protein